MATRSQILRKDQLLFSLIETRQNILSEVSKLSRAEQDRVFLGSWSVKDLLAHLAGWDYTNREAASYVMAGKLPTFYAYHDRDWARYNAMLVAEYKRDQLDELIGLVKDAQQQLINFIQTIPPSSFNKDFGVRFRGYRVTIQRLLEAERKDEQTHLQQIIDFFKERR